MEVLKPQLSSRKSSLRRRTSASQKPSISDAVPPQPTTPAPSGPRSMEVAITFDTTGSMSQCLEQVQAQVNQMIERLFMDIPDLKIAVIAHGDYCDEEHFYVTQHIDFTNQLPTLATFVKDVGGTGGGDWEECYEYVLSLARHKLSWTPGTQRALVMIGDAAPHAPNTEASRGYDWRHEVDQLNRAMGVSVYGVQCLNEDRATPFWRELGESVGGRHLKLDEVGSVVDMIMAIVYREHGAGFLQAYEQEVRVREGAAMRNGLEDMFQRLRNDDDEPEAALPSAARRPPPRSKNCLPTKKARKVEVAKPKKLKKAVAQPKARVQKVKATVDPKTKAQKQRRQNREIVNQPHFALKSLNWSPWRKAMSMVVPANGDQWLPRRLRQPGFRNASLFADGNRSKLAVYEFAVQTGSRRKMQAVYCRCSRGIPNGCRWDRHLLRDTGVQTRVSRVLQQRSAGNEVVIMARRAMIPSAGFSVEGRHYQGARRVTELLKKRYDYAWQPCRSRQEKFRLLEKNGCKISS